MKHLNYVCATQCLTACFLARTDKTRAPLKTRLEGRQLKTSTLLLHPRLVFSFAQSTIEKIYYIYFSLQIS